VSSLSPIEVRGTQNAQQQAVEILAAFGVLLVLLCLTIEAQKTPNDLSVWELVQQGSLLQTFAFHGYKESFK